MASGGRLFATYYNGGVLAADGSDLDGRGYLAEINPATGAVMRTVGMFTGLTMMLGYKMVIDPSGGTSGVVYMMAEVGGICRTCSAYAGNRFALFTMDLATGVSRQLTGPYSVYPGPLLGNLEEGLVGPFQLVGIRRTGQPVLIWQANGNVSVVQLDLATGVSTAIGAVGDLYYCPNTACTFFLDAANDVLYVPGGASNSYSNGGPVYLYSLNLATTVSSKALMPQQPLPGYYLLNYLDT